MTHLQVSDRLACGAPPRVGPGVSYKEFEKVTCKACQGSAYGEAAERILDAEAHFEVRGLAEMANCLPHIEGPLGDMSKVDPTADLKTRVQQRQATMSEAEKMEGFRRVTSMVADTCPSCGGSIKYNEHDEGCRGPDPLEWDLTAAESQAELELLGIDVEAAKAACLKTIDEHLAKLKDNSND